MITRSSIIFLTISVVLASAEEFIPDNVFPEKRGSTGFQGTYGKSNLVSWGDEELSKRAPMGFQGMRGKKSSIIGEAENDLLSEETRKRAPMGFQGMRGKKDNLLTSDFRDAYPHDDYEKRAPMGFQGMRGKKTSVQDEYYKRAPMGFQGMRGKKSFEQMLDEINKWSNAKHREMYMLDYPDDSARRISPIDAYRSVRDKKFRLIREWEKKAPMGFQGMRGKKMIPDTPDDLDKGNVMDFRARKDTFDDYAEYPTNPSDYEKRDDDFQEAGSTGESFRSSRMSFRGARSKRDASGIYETDTSVARKPELGYQGSDNGNHLAPYEVEKRSPFGYLAGRRKKNRRWELLGKFVGVRGKKSSAGPTLG